ncbi:MAG: cupin domain-containing protein [Desulfonatronovibrio sp. MSAO_Bac4]|nr:MAG: cupin domain-containing protein [Desulfonatronovibrio sp. MSAO_Bac4]
MKGMFFQSKSRKYKDHPKFTGVQIAMLVADGKSDMVSVSELIIEPGVEVPVHTHDLQADSIYIVSGKARAFLNGEWDFVESGDYLFVPPNAEHGISNTGREPLRLFIHHSPPLF